MQDFCQKMALGTDLAPKDDTLRPSAVFIAAVLLLGSCRATTDNGAARVQTENALTPANAERGSCVDLNTASVEELMRLPGVGEVLARRIIDHRKRNGSIRRPQEIIIIDGFSERKYRDLSEFVCAR